MLPRRDDCVLRVWQFPCFLFVCLTADTIDRQASGFLVHSTGVLLCQWEAELFFARARCPYVDTPSFYCIVHGTKPMLAFRPSTCFVPKRPVHVPTNCLINLPSIHGADWVESSRIASIGNPHVDEQGTLHE